MLDIIFGTKKYICIIFFVLQFITLMLHLEIFVFNFCGLNKNTRRNIQEREAHETYLNSNETRPSSKSDIDIAPNYSINIKESDRTSEIF